MPPRTRKHEDNESPYTAEDYKSDEKSSFTAICTFCEKEVQALRYPCPGSRYINTRERCIKHRREIKTHLQENNRPRVALRHPSSTGSKTSKCVQTGFEVLRTCSSNRSYWRILSRDNVSFDTEPYCRFSTRDAFLVDPHVEAIFVCTSGSTL